MMKSQLFYIYNYATAKVRPFCLLYCSLNFMYFLWARHVHNKTAPCGMIKVFKLNWIELNLFEEKGEPKRYRTEVLPLTSLTPYARPDRLTTGSPQSWTCHIVRSMLTSSAKLCPQSPGPPLSFVLLTCHTFTHSSGAVWKSRWHASWAIRPNEPSGFRGRKAILTNASALVTACP